ncbi:MAG: hypothetical protein PHF91_01305 [Bacilli bacterium]|jgi:NADH:ubiquinone oxidoreductase subunit 3 (subunit A)|nr:hypothetical protein [Bacilli bacterium]
MGPIAKALIFAGVTLLTGVILLVTAFANKSNANDSEKVKEQTKVMHQWGIIGIICAVVVAPFYFFLAGQELILIIIYGAVLIINGFIVRSRIGKVERKYYESNKETIEKERLETKDSKSDADFEKLENEYLAAKKKREEQHKQ